MLRTVLRKHQLLLVHQEQIPVCDTQGMLASGLVTSGWARMVLQEQGSSPQSMRLGEDGKQPSGNGHTTRRQASPGQTAPVTGRCDFLVHVRTGEELAANPGSVEGERGKASSDSASLGPRVWNRMPPVCLPLGRPGRWGCPPRGSRASNDSPPGGGVVCICQRLFPRAEAVSLCLTQASEAQGSINAPPRERGSCFRSSLAP